MKVHTSSKLYRYATKFPLVQEPKSGCELLLGALCTTLAYPALLVVFITFVSCIGAVTLLLLGVPEPEPLAESIALGFGVGSAIIAAVGGTLFLANLLCRRVEVVSD